MPLNNSAAGMDRLPAKVSDRIGSLTQRLIYGDLSDYGLPQPPLGLYSTLEQRRIGPAVDCGFVEAVKGGRIEIVAGVEGFDGPDVLLADGSPIQPEVVIAATGYRRGLEPLVGHLPGVLLPDGHPAADGGRENPAAPGLFFTGYVAKVSGQLRQMRFEAKRIARAVQRRPTTAQAAQSSPAAVRERAGAPA
jgi:putative flavoprotein involved in K+ transport